MLQRIRREEIVFRHPFPLTGLPGRQPAGTYVMEVEEELVEGLSFPVYRRVMTTLLAQPEAGGGMRAMVVDPEELGRVRAADAAATA